ncbi:protein translocase subunit SecF [Ornithinicoccus halotolerans]|uniref:protein translocase subunit SecF n=1 Tax=Ornithinicoccus halotolerans TaxID=1748220 RepID=UPI001296DB9B|nr:protein translocase subunit SecF [Ornithinicoccus halotolerans]
MRRLARVGNDLYSGNRSFPIVARRRLWYAISVVLILLSLVGLVGRGLNFGIEFRGGTEMRVTGVSQLSEYETRATEAVQETAPEAATVTVTQVGDDGVRIQTGDLDPQVVEDARAALAEEFSVPVQDVTSSFVGPSWGQTITTKAIQALVVFLLLVTLVLAVYFSTWKMAVAALVALLHDVVFTVGLYALLGIEVSPASVIGFLTILGYSIYDTIVVFDKVRENTEYALESRTMSYAQAANLAVNQTLVRSVNTSVVALLPVGAILLFGITLIGPGTLLDLAAALFIGIAVGTYSSVFVATPLLVHLREGEPELRQLEQRVQKRGAQQPVPATVGGPATPQTEPAPPTEVAEDEAPATGGGPGSPSSEHPGGPGAGAATDRSVHPYAQRGPRNQPRRRRRRR